MNANLIGDLREKTRIFLAYGHDAEILEISASSRIITTLQRVIMEADRV